MKKISHTLFKFMFWLAAVTVLPVFIARSFEAETFAFVAVWDFFALLFIVGARDYKRNAKPSKPSPPIFPWWGF